jgi:D-sedoheptulose 7-phosphate isomerase
MPNRRATPLERRARAALRRAETVARRTARIAPRQLAAAVALMTESLEAGGTVYFCGNGGSAADAQHFSTELAGRFLIDRPALAAVALTTNTSALTAIGNDYGFEHVFARQLESTGTPGDVLVAITTSGGSKNVLEAVRAARRLGMKVVGMTGRRGAAFARRCDVALVSPSASTPEIQTGHLMMGHAVCELIERAMVARAARLARSAARASRRARRTAPRRAAPARTGRRV